MKNLINEIRSACNCASTFDLVFKLIVTIAVVRLLIWTWKF